MNPAQSSHFTAAIIAKALGRRRQSVARSLADVPADGAVLIAGRSVPAWTFLALPLPVRSDLEAASQRLSYRNAEALLCACQKSEPLAWQPPVPLKDCAPGAVDKAVKLQRALARALDALPQISILAAVQQFALADYAKQFGHAVSPGHLRALIQRTLDRDAGAGNWARLELYLSETPARRAVSKVIIPLSAEAEFRHLHQLIAGFKNPAAPGLDEKALLWIHSFESLEEKIADGKPAKKTRLALLQFLERNAPFLSRNPEGIRTGSLRAMFRRKYSAWLASDRNALALADARPQKSGNFRAPEFTEEKRDELLALTVLNHGGHVAPAWREMRHARLLGNDLESHYLANPSRKSYVPETVRASVRHEAAMLDEIHHGPRQARLNGAHISRDWTTVSALDYWTGDDTTLNVYVKKRLANGGFDMIRGQTLLFADCRSRRILGFKFIPETAYTANAIRSIITHLADEYGLPRKGFNFENGAWKARVLVGKPNAEPMSWSDTEMGLRQFGLRFIHSIPGNPRAKIIEGVIGALQNLMMHLPGYVGRNERTEKFERVQALLRRAKTQDPEALAYFLSEDQYLAEIEAAIDRYNAEPQHGKMTCGLSPDEAFDRFQNHADPLVKLPPSCRYLLAQHRRPLRVTPNGLRYDNKHKYQGRELGPLIGQTVFAWFNPDFPDLLTVTDTQCRNAFCIARAPDLPAMDATPEQMSAAMARINGQGAFARERYRVIKARNPLPFRQPFTDAHTVELGAHFEQQREALEAETTARQRRQSQGRKAFGRLGVAAPADISAERAAAANTLAKLLNEDES